ncbi:Zinc finger HIT domain-containing protein 1 [Aphelenchoides bicaudatus]|nr:Zinc finger HIT domain-containing protein 1 [Aphelenchoides bicaudatus]
MSAYVAKKNRKSERLGVIDSTRRVDEATIQKRLQKQLANLERTNVQEDPHANVAMHKAAPKFRDDLVVEGQGKKPIKRKSEAFGERATAIPTKKGGKLRAELSKTRFRKNFQQLNEEFEQALLPNYSGPTYSKVAAAPSKYPRRKFCDVCGKFAKYCCIKCSVSFCSVDCNSVHEETRCSSWIR